MSHDMVDPKFLSAGLPALVEPFALYFWRQPVDLYNKQQKAIIAGQFYNIVESQLWEEPDVFLHDYEYKPSTV